MQTRHSLFLPLLLGLAFALLAASAAADGIRQWHTGNGMKVIFQQAESLPIVDFRLVFDAGGARDMATGYRLPGIAKLTNNLVYEGAENLNADQIAEQFASLGVDYSNGSYRDMAVLSMRTLSFAKQLEPALALWRKILATANFPPEAIRRVSDNMLVELDYEEQTPSKKASRLFYRSLYGDHPYGSPPNGTRDSIKAITRDKIIRYYKQYYVAKNAVLAIVGNLSYEKARDIAENISTALPEGSKAEHLPEVKQLTDSAFVSRDHASTQTTVIMGQPAMARNDKDFYILYLGNHILGSSGFSGRLMKEVRVNRGLTYSIGSYFVPMRVAGPFQVSFTTKQASAQEALDLVSQQISEFLEQGPTAEEMEEAKLNITGNFPLKLVSNRDIVENLAMIGFYDLPLDYMEKFNQHIQKVTAEQIKEAFRRRIHPPRLAVIAVGPEASSTLVQPGVVKDHGKNNTQ